jgi:hypothetical protein
LFFLLGLGLDPAAAASSLAILARRLLGESGVGGAAGVAGRSAPTDLVGRRGDEGMALGRRADREAKGDLRGDWDDRGVGSCPAVRRGTFSLS